MRKCKVLFALLAAMIIIPTGFGQTQEDLLRRLEALDQRLKAVESENAQLKTQLVENDDAVLESQVNALLERYAAGTTVNSTANPITMTGEFRFRTTWTLGDPANNSPGGPLLGIGGGELDELDGSYVDSRVRLGFLYEFTRDVSAFAELQAHWAFGDFSSPSMGNDPSPLASPYGFYHGESTLDMELYQGWIEVRNIFDRPEFSNKTGRQEIVLGNQFQFGNADWYNGWTFDASRWDWDDESFRITGIIARLATADRDLNQTPSYLSTHDSDDLYAIYFTLKSIENVELDLYWIYIDGHFPGLPSNGALGNNVGGGLVGANAYWHTIGARLGGNFDVAEGLDWNVEGAYQFGNINGGGTVNDVDGWTVEAEVGITFNKDNMFRLFARFLFAQGGDNKDSGYIPLFPNRHSNTGFRARYGLFDLMPMTNVLSLQGGLTFNPDPDWTLGATVVWATADDDNPLIAASNGDDYGWEIDVFGEYRYSEQLTVGVGAAFLFPDDEGELTWGLDDDMHLLVYLQARLVF